MKDLWTHIRELSELDGISGREDDLFGTDFAFRRR